MLRRTGVAAVVLAVLLGCSPSDPDDAPAGLLLPAPSSPVKDWKTVRMELHRGMCRGTCPAYRIAITSDGAVSYCGIAYVEATGERTRAVPEIEARQLFDRFLRAKFFDLRDSYVEGPTDGPFYTVTVWHDGRGKQISHYSGSEEGNALLSELEAAIDDLAGSKEWIGSGNGASPLPFPDCARTFETPVPSRPF
jgi:Domain of unknown function (DUF6438)